jgi:hypothetical protein
MTRFTRYGIVVLLLATLAELTACSLVGHGTSPSPSPSAMTDEQVLAIARQYVQCLRDHGVTDIKEPTIVEHRLQGGGPAGDSDPAIPEATQACESIVARLPSSVTDSRHVSAEELEKIGRFAACLRQHGYPEWPDPDGEGFFPIHGTALELGEKSDQFQEARQACQQYYAGPIRASKP